MTPDQGTSQNTDYLRERLSERGEYGISIAPSYKLDATENPQTGVIEVICGHIWTEDQHLLPCFSAAVQVTDGKYILPDECFFTGSNQAVYLTFDTKSALVKPDGSEGSIYFCVDYKISSTEPTVGEIAKILLISPKSTYKSEAKGNITLFNNVLGELSVEEAERLAFDKGIALPPHRIDVLKTIYRVVGAIGHQFSDDELDGIGLLVAA